ncbi:MAG: Gfo/Idh/MocA family oxidoreductase [Woeseiaceae bacterium]|nr:Gfo/Idh/MocA family oxidoreductase [Woeseiaceae bacterium]
MTPQKLRWGIVGTGSIANAMAERLASATAADLCAVCSRTMASANAFGDAHGIALRFDDWRTMMDSQDIDAVYVATPTGIREEICVAAASAGKHVIGEKPFANLASLKRITTACRENDVVFMDATHFVHHPRTAELKQLTAPGWVWSVDSAFHASLKDRSNIRYNPDLEPYGAVGDTGWYNMRAAVEFLSPEITLVSASTAIRRDPDTRAVISGSGMLRFDDGSTSTWNCGFDSGAVVMDLRISGTDACVNVDDFIGHQQDFTADYRLRRGGWGPDGSSETVSVASPASAATRMFDDVASLVGDVDGIAASIRASERTQAWLDAAWEAGLNSEAN